MVTPRRLESPAKRGLTALLTVLLAAFVHAAPLQFSSADGNWRVAADGATLTVFDAQGRPARRHAAPAVSGMLDAAPRRSFIIVFDSLPQLWELLYDPHAEPLYRGMVHDYRMGEGIAEPGFLNVRRTQLQAPLREPGFDAKHALVLARAADQADGQAVLVLVQLDVRKPIATFVVRGDPHTAAMQRVERDGREWLEVPDRGGGPPLRIDPREMRLLDTQ